MPFEPGDVVFLKSGGLPMTVAAVEEDSVECVWIGEDGELFRETIPSVTLAAAPDEAEEDEDESEDESEDKERDEEDTERPDADEVKKAKRRKSA
jgi:uncharacterized protein YodC (DUF2158 family)